MTTKYRALSEIAKRWAIPVAVVLLPGGFAVLACGWMAKTVLAKKRLLPAAASVAISIPRALKPVSAAPADVQLRTALGKDA